MRRRIFLSGAALIALLGAAALPANELDGARLGAPPVDAWPTFHGDYTGRRYSTLDQINAGNVQQLQIAWTSRFNDVGAQRGAPQPVIKGTPLMVNGVLYVTLPDLVFALDAHTGVRLWTYRWQDKGGHLVGNRGVGMYKDRLYFMGPDNWVICLDATTGKERWRKESADARKQ
jgi:alcohol dehydrogenase (cytochrome c)